ncbi:MAG: hypothetical protein M1813_003917 [Trichoglossum hirsutum]|jgi:hypothetical protein|nr:MAG: hypothetical protein M1813_003917 [Trichoglossum hirsutum]
MGFVPFSHSTSIPPKNHPYASSISSSASSSSSSVFSTDGASSQASASSTNSLQIVWETDHVDAYSSCTDSYLSAHDLAPNGISRALRRGPGKDFRVANEIHADDCRSKPDHTLGAGGDVPPEQRKHPRRNNRSGLDCESTATCHHQPPSLPRQSARKVNFVDNLVGKVAQD